MYHVTYKNSKRKLILKDRSELIDKIMEMFKIPNAINLQQLDIDFAGEWVDIDDLESLPEKCRLRALDANGDELTTVSGPGLI